MKEFLARQPKEPTQSKTPQQKYTPMFTFMGINVTHHTFFSAAYSGAYLIVFAVAGFALLSTALEYYYRTKGKENTADAIQTATKVILPLAFYLFLYFGIVAVF
ncbi:hypothetical protein NDK43_03985 [Neobacillus pocheonensis]|uniref:Uncharacterized protein n=1 Tax=Neobacillus pocheonensis TaxID=363869 RepID=A0ABT0W5V6_9BACI|nr:hypothetical protein [Neobacillus pocheonensis]